jgi:glucosamine-6-phosphate deaminase
LLILKIFPDRIAAAQAAAGQALRTIQQAIRKSGRARIVAATGTSQLEFLGSLAESGDVPWGDVELFHLDEYIGLPMSHPASFSRYLEERLIGKTGITNFHLLDGAEAPSKVIAAVGRALTAAPIDLAFVGIGENGHIAFNDPPADFDTEEAYLTVTLDDTSRRQQVGEGWFKDLSEVPTQAITMSVRQILKSRAIIAVVPDSRKARAVKLCFEGEVSAMTPASILRTHRRATVYLDRHSAALLASSTISKFRAPAGE